MAQEVFYSPYELGIEGARKKAAMLRDEHGYTIINIEPCLIWQAGALSTPYAKNYKQKEPGYKITVDDGRPHYDSEYPNTGAVNLLD